MQKKISVVTLIVAVVTAALLGVVGSMVVLNNKYEALLYDISVKYTLGYQEKLAEIKEQYDDQYDSFISKYKKLIELSQAYEELYVGEIDEEKLEEMILTGYVIGTGDKYGGYYTAEEMEDLLNSLDGELHGIGVSVIYNSELSAIEIITVMPDSPALEAGICAGDYVVYVGSGENAESVAELGYDVAVDKLRGEEGTVVEFTVYRNGEYIEYSLVRRKIVEQTVLYHVYDLDSTVGVIKVTGFNKKTPEQFIAAVDELTAGGCTSLVVDVRNNPGGELTAICEVLDYLLPAGPIIRTIDKEGNEKTVATSDASYNDIPLSVIVNGSTASAAELFASALQDYDRATVIGTQTYGKGSMQTIKYLSDGSGYRVTYRLYCPPFSDNYDGVGVTPDIVEDLDEALKTVNPYKISDEEDNQLRRAVEALKQ